VKSLEWMLTRHPDITADRAGCARVYGQLAFAHAAMGSRAAALSWAGRALARSPFEPRAVLAATTALRLMKSEAVLHHLHLRGRGHLRLRRAARDRANPVPARPGGPRAA
jgi:hypothetical protein